MKTTKIINQGLLLHAAFAGMILFGINWHIAIAAWLSPVFILRYTRKTKTPGFLLFFVLAIMAGVISRTCFVIVDIFIVYLINGLVFGITYSIPYLIDRLFYQKLKGFYTSLLFPSAVVFTEYFVAKAMGTWGTVAHTQYPFNPLIQLTSITGIFGVSFLVSWFGATINWLMENELRIEKIKMATLIYGGVLAVVILFGSLRTTFYPFTSPTVTLAAISGDIDIHKIVKENYI